MTRQAENNYRCHSCDVNLICPNCKSLQPMGSSFSLWLRKLRCPLDSSNIFNTDIDHVWFHFRQGWFITLEEKTNGKRVASTQQEVLDIASEKMLQSNMLKHKTIRGERPIEYRGHYTIIFEKSNPTNSQWILINNHVTDTDGLLSLLKKGRFHPQNNPIQLDIAGADTLSVLPELDLLSDDIEHLKIYIYETNRGVKDIAGAIESIKNLILQLSEKIPLVRRKQKQAANGNSNTLPLFGDKED